MPHCPQTWVDISCWIQLNKMIIQLVIFFWKSWEAEQVSVRIQTWKHPSKRLWQISWRWLCGLWATQPENNFKFSVPSFWLANLALSLWSKRRCFGFGDRIYQKWCNSKSGKDPQFVCLLWVKRCERWDVGTKVFWMWCNAPVMFRPPTASWMWSLHKCVGGVPVNQRTNGWS